MVHGDMQAVNVLDRARRLGIRPNTVMFNTALCALGKAGRVDQAAALFWQIPQPDAISHETMVAAYGMAGRTSDAERALAAMIGSGFQPRDFAYCAIIQSYRCRAASLPAVCACYGASSSFSLLVCVRLLSPLLPCRRESAKFAAALLTLVEAMYARAQHGRRLARRPRRQAAHAESWRANDGAHLQRAAGGCRAQQQVRCGAAAAAGDAPQQHSGQRFDGAAFAISRPARRRDDRRSPGHNSSPECRSCGRGHIARALRSVLKCKFHHGQAVHGCYAQVLVVVFVRQWVLLLPSIGAGGLSDFQRQSCCSGLKQNRKRPCCSDCAAMTPSQKSTKTAC